MGRQNFRTYTLALSAGVEYDLNVDGDMYAVIENTGEFTIIFDESSRVAKATAGTGANFRTAYERVRFVSSTAQTITVILGFGEYRDARATVNATINTTIEPSDTLTPLAEVSIGAGLTVLLAAANVNRKELRVGVKSTEANGVYLGDASVGAVTPGGYVEEGSIEYLNTESAVYGYNPSGTDSITVNVMSLERP